MDEAGLGKDNEFCYYSNILINNKENECSNESDQDF